MEDATDPADSQAAAPLALSLRQLERWRDDFRGRILAELEQSESSAPETLQFAARALLDAWYRPKDLSALLGPSQTTITRWAIGQTIPRSPPYRRWLVEQLMQQLRDDLAAEANG